MQNKEYQKPVENAVSRFMESAGMVFDVFVAATHDNEKSALKMIASSAVRKSAKRIMTRA